MAWMNGQIPRTVSPSFDVIVLFRDDSESLHPAPPDNICAVLRARNFTCDVVAWNSYESKYPVVRESNRKYFQSAVSHASKVLGSGRGI